MSGNNEGRNSSCQSHVSCANCFVDVIIGRTVNQHIFSTRTGTVIGSTFIIVVHVLNEMLQMQYSPKLGDLN